MPARAGLPNRLDAVLRWSTWLARRSLELLPDPDAEDLLALTLLHESRRSARTTHDGEMILLEDQDRSLWNRELLEEGIRLLRHAFASRRLEPYTMRAAISALHAEASSSAATHLVRSCCLARPAVEDRPSPVVELNRVVSFFREALTSQEQQRRFQRRRLAEIK